MLQKQVTSAPYLVLDEAGIPYSHIDAYPEDGVRLLPADSKYSRRLSRIQRKLDDLSDDEFWDNDNVVENLRVLSRASSE